MRSSRRPHDRTRRSRLTQLFLLTAACLIAICPGNAAAQSLRGSSSSLDRQNRQARRHDYTFLREPGQLTRFVTAGLLVPVEGNDDYLLKDVSFQVARPEVSLFIERLSAQYRQACGAPLVVTSLTRPRSSQPPNASERSVHPTGMALDLRRPANRACRTWLESTLLSLEKRRVLDATRERNPAHYHVAIFPEAYVAYVAGLTGRGASELMASAATVERYTVRRQDTLWAIARRHDTTPGELRLVNDLGSSVIHPGQVLEIPLSSQ